MRTIENQWIENEREMRIKTVSEKKNEHEREFQIGEKYDI